MTEKNEKKIKESAFDRLNDEQKAAQIPYYVHEMEMTREERANKRLVIFCIILFAAFVISNALWIIRESQYHDEVYTYEVTQDSGEGGENTYTGNTVKIMGGDYNGETDGQSNSEAQGAENGR